MKRILIISMSILMLTISVVNAETWEIPPKYEQSSQYSEGAANCSLYTLFINRNDDILFQYPDNAIRFSNSYSEGLSIGNNSRTGSSLEYTIMDRHGNIRVITGFSQINSFSNGFAMVANADKTRFGYIDKTLNTVIPLTYTAAGDFSEGFARVRNNDGNWGYVNTKGEMVIDFSFSNALDFHNGLAAVKNNIGLWGYIDYNGNYIIKPQFSKAYDFSDGVAVIQTINGLGFVTESGNVTELQSNIINLNNFNYGVAVAYDGVRYGLIDKSGTIILDFEWEYLSDCREGIITGKKEGICYILDSKGKTMETTTGSEIKEASENLINAQKGGLWGYIANPLANPSTWAKNTIDKMFEWGYMTDYISYNYQDNITRSEFCIAIASLIEKKTNTIFPITERIVFDDTTDVNISKLVNAGIIDGVSETEFAPNDYLTREQAAKIFAYMGNNFINWEPISSDTKFIDDDDISKWAYESVYLMQANSIMEGYEDGGFRPYIYLTKEQAIAMMYRFISKF